MNTEHMLDCDNIINSIQTLFCKLDEKEARLAILQKKLLRTSVELALMGKPLKKIFEDLEFGFESDTFLVATFDLCDKGELFNPDGSSMVEDSDIRLVKSMVYDSFEEYLGGVSIAYCCESSKYFGDILINLSDVDSPDSAESARNRLNQTAESALSAIEQYCGIHLIFAMSNVTRGFTKLNKAKQEAYQALSRISASNPISRMAISDLPTVTYQNRSFYDDNPDAKPHYQQERLFFQSILRHDFSQAQTVQELLVALDIQNGVPVDMISRNIAGHLDSVSRLINLPKDMSDSLHSAINDIRELTSIRELKSAVIDFFQLLSNMESNLSKGNDTMQLIRQHILDNYADPNISLFSISEFYGINQSYASRMFKACYGTGILDYIHTLRLTHARELLVSSDKSIDEIYSLVGYTNRRTFDRTFKQAEGMTATTYRNKFKN